MTKIAELKDKGAVVAWSPIGGEGENNYADVIALGSKVRACDLYCPLVIIFVVTLSKSKWCVL